MGRPSPDSSKACRSAALGAVLALLPSLATACMIETGGLEFGVYEPYASAPLTSTGWIEVRCEVVTSYRVLLSSASGGADDRALLGPRDRLRYQIYLDAARTMIWGDGSALSSVLAVTSRGERHSLYGRIPAGQNVRPGHYSDLVTVMVEF